jgi:hypothetical protein
MTTSSHCDLAGAAVETAASRRQPSPNRSRPQQNRPAVPALRFTPYAWAKLLYLRDVGGTEIGGFGIGAAEDPFLVEDFVLVRQDCTELTVQFDDEAVADFFDAQVDAGRRPEQFGRIWMHTHPGDSPQPSGTDEATFAEAFGQADWTVMFILARGGAIYARLRFNVGPGAELNVPVVVDYAAPFEASAKGAWLEEYLACVSPPTDDDLFESIPPPAETARQPAGSRRPEAVGEGDEFLFAADEWDWQEFLVQDEQTLMEQSGLALADVRMLQRAAERYAAAMGML